MDQQVFPVVEQPLALPCMKLSQHQGCSAMLGTGIFNCEALPLPSPKHTAFLNTSNRAEYAEKHKLSYHAAKLSHSVPTLTQTEEHPTTHPRPLSAHSAPDLPLAPPSNAEQPCSVLAGRPSSTIPPRVLSRTSLSNHP